MLESETEGIAGCWRHDPSQVSHYQGGCPGVAGVGVVVDPIGHQLESCPVQGGSLGVWSWSLWGGG